MRIVDAGYEILDPLNGEEILKKIERVARVCYKSEDKSQRDPLRRWSELSLRVITWRCWSTTLLV